MEMLSPLFQNLLREYSASHTEPRNRWVHMVGIPMIVIGTLGLLGRVHLPEGVRLDLILWASASIFYIRNARWMSFPFVIVLLLLCVLARFLGPHTLWLLFGIGWIMQTIGHVVFEQARPNFLDNLTHLFIGPFWIYCHFLKRVPAYSDLFTSDQS
jgi:uncharacterized membrane protein YGL010W